MAPTCDKCKQHPSNYSVTIRDGRDMTSKNLCFTCYKASQTESIIDVKIIK
ncbi:MAG: hypothetical protein GYA24_13965 [Candidatus Lokiarchaeota archaeon]|nr:hypothetical protein [Candidatus Lokiarchaeota archaeon]